MFYIFLALGLTLTGIITFTSHFQRISQRHITGVNYLLTILSTFAGVLLAIAISDYEAQDKERQDLIKVLNAGVAVIDTVELYSNGLREASIQYSEQNIEVFFTKNPLPYPDFLEESLKQSTIIKNLSETSLSSVSSALITLKRAQKTIRNKADIGFFLHVLSQVKGILSLEIQFQQRNLDYPSLERELTALLNTPYSETDKASFKTLIIE